MNLKIASVFLIFIANIRADHVEIPIVKKEVPAFSEAGGFLDHYLKRTSERMQNAWNGIGINVDLAFEALKNDAADVGKKAYSKAAEEAEKQIRERMPGRKKK